MRKRRRAHCSKPLHKRIIQVKNMALKNGGVSGTGDVGPKKVANQACDKNFKCL